MATRSSGALSILSSRFRRARHRFLRRQLLTFSPPTCFSALALMIHDEGIWYAHALGSDFHNLQLDRWMRWQIAAGEHQDRGSVFYSTSIRKRSRRALIYFADGRPERRDAR